MDMTCFFWIVRYIKRYKCTRLITRFDDIESGEAPQVNFHRSWAVVQSCIIYILPMESILNGMSLSNQFNYPKKTKQFFCQTTRIMYEGCGTRVYGASSTFVIIQQPTRMWDMDILCKVMRECIMLHNMIVEDERNMYSPNWENIDFEPSNNSSSKSSVNVQAHILPQFEVHVLGHSKSNIHTRAELRDIVQHIQLKKGSRIAHLAEI